MKEKKKIFIIIGSASNRSANQQLIDHIVRLTKEEFEFTIFNELKQLPHFDPELATDDPPVSILQLRNNIDKADGVIICTPEYVFSIPSGLKNLIEWCVCTTVFSDKPVGLITASADGRKGHEELQLILNTIMAKFTPATTLLIQGVKGKINKSGEITDSKTTDELNKLIDAFRSLVEIEKFV